MPLDGLDYTPDPILSALQRGRARIEQGWCKSQLRRPRFGAAGLIGYDYCLVGSTMDEPRELDIACQNVIHKTLKTIYYTANPYSISEYNDDPFRTKAEILQLYASAIE